MNAQEEGSHPKGKGVRVELRPDHVSLAHLGKGATERFNRNVPGPELPFPIYVFPVCPSPATKKPDLGRWQLKSK